MFTTSTAVQFLSYNDQYRSAGETWRVLERESLPTGNIRVRGECLTGESAGNTFDWYAAPGFLVEQVVTNRPIEIDPAATEAVQVVQWADNEHFTVTDARYDAEDTISAAADMAESANLGQREYKFTADGVALRMNLASGPDAGHYIVTLNPTPKLTEDDVVRDFFTN